MPTAQRTRFPTFYNSALYYTDEEMAVFERHADARGTISTEWVTVIPRSKKDKEEISARDWQRRTGKKGKGI